MQNPALFGVAGNCDDFYAAGNKASVKMPQYLKDNGLSVYEYQCGKGVKISEKTARELGQAAIECGIMLTVHAPYYISLSSESEETRTKSIKYITDTLEAARWMGAKRIVIHSGSCAKMTRAEALSLAQDTLTRAIAEAENLGLADIHICPETMGKINQLGTVEEVVELCKLDERLIPTIDFGHVNARTLGGLRNKEDFEYIFDVMENGLGRERAANFHSHYSRIEFTDGGEKKHHTFADTEYGPEFAPIAQIIAKRGLSPVIICESRGTQTRDAVEMQRIYEEELKKLNA
ncbi:MAG: TIM barrel protein [Oscillospiraceae bacterium]|nr:TIM barrel protein [Oscillospiraceae bacterium]